MAAFLNVPSHRVSSSTLKWRFSEPLCRAPESSRITSLPNCVKRARMAVEVDDKAIVKEYFNETGFDRWNRIYSESGDVNKVQLDIRDGHAETVRKILAWVDEDGDVAGQTFADAGCGVGSLAIPLCERGAVVVASDISAAMVNEATDRSRSVLGNRAGNCTFAVTDLEELNGIYDTVCCVDVMIHYPTQKAAGMIKHLASLSKRRLIISFAPKTFFLAILKKIGEFFPGPSKATRAYLHTEDEVVAALKECGFSVRRSEFVGTRFYFSRILEAVKIE
jgi:magnesium-protoporphyrin O-methyltransferase